MSIHDVKVYDESNKVKMTKAEIGQTRLLSSAFGMLMTNKNTSHYILVVNIHSDDSNEEYATFILDGRVFKLNAQSIERNSILVF